ncbi:hypothetical protein [Streptomyces sp. NPDC059994]|uniref:hypothetical protein n=1 Tax=Streptomyces sp. NPDC059994 TaxID=3347029 RepID=UPI0036B5B989
MPDRPPSCRFPARCDWSSSYDECSHEACYDPGAPAPLDEFGQPFLDLDHPGDQPPESYYVPGYCFHLGAKGGPWPVTRRPVYRDWPDHITDLRLPEETL